MTIGNDSGPDTRHTPDQRALRIAQIAPLAESVPPKLYGGSERIVSWLTEGLIQLGHDVTLFASGDSETAARLVPMWPRAIRLESRPPDTCALQVLVLEKLAKRMDEFDLIHFHTEHIHLPFVRRTDVPCLTTLHGSLDVPGLRALYQEFRDVPLVSISDAQRQPLPQAHWAATIYHGLPGGLHRLGNGSGGYLAFLGRIAPEKGVDQAIDIARLARIPLRLAAKVDPADRDYFTQIVQPRIDDTSVCFVGEINEREKTQFLGDALALLFPIDWPEPFGLVMIEAMACGTPVVAFRRGSVPEVIDEGVTGMIVTNCAEAAAAVGRAQEFDRRRCAARFVERFSAERMAREYFSVYATLHDRRAAKRASPRAQQH